MPAEIVVVLTDRQFADETVARLQAAGRDAVAIPDSMIALDVLEGAARIELLVTCLDFGERKPNGVALARMAKLRRPDLKVMFVGDQALEGHTEGLGEFMASPIQVDDLVSEGLRLLPRTAAQPDQVPPSPESPSLRDSRLP